jgi:hypothetical protein
LHEPSVQNGMSGSPIINEDGYAVGVVSTGYLNPRLAADLPRWLTAPPPSIEVPDEVAATFRAIAE